MTIKFKSGIELPGPPGGPAEAARLEDLTPVFLTRAELAAREDPAGSGLYPSLRNLHVCVTDADPALETAAMMTPDYANMEMVNRITANNGMWIADRVGFVKTVISESTSGQQDHFTTRINAQIMQSEQVEANTGLRYQTGIYPVKAGDTVYLSIQVNNNNGAVECYFIPPKFVSMAEPVVSEDFLNTAMVPDYGNMETNNYLQSVYNAAIPASYGFTIDKTGFLYLRGNVYNSAALGQNDFFAISFLINGKQIGAWISDSNINAIGRLSICNIYPVSAGDVVSYATTRSNDSITAYAGLTCSFIPPKFVTVQAPNIVISGASYSETEQATGETWIDGKPISRKVLTGNIVASSSAHSTVQVFTGVSEIVKSGGWLMNGTSDNKFAFGQFYNAAGFIVSSNLFVNNNGEVYIESASSGGRSGTTNNAYRIWIEYTKKD